MDKLKTNLVPLYCYLLTRWVAIKWTYNYMKTLQTQFFIEHHEVTGEKYDEMLGCLPPERMAYNAFLVGEPTDHAIMLDEGTGKQYVPRFALYYSKDHRYYYGGLCTTKAFDMFLIPEVDQFNSRALDNRQVI